MNVHIVLIWCYLSLKRHPKFQSRKTFLFEGFLFLSTLTPHKPFSALLYLFFFHVLHLECILLTIMSPISACQDRSTWKSMPWSQWPYKTMSLLRCLIVCVWLTETHSGQIWMCLRMRGSHYWIGFQTLPWKLTGWLTNPLLFETVNFLYFSPSETHMNKKYWYSLLNIPFSLAFQNLTAASRYTNPIHMLLPILEWHSLSAGKFFGLTGQNVHILYDSAALTVGPAEI